MSSKTIANIDRPERHDPVSPQQVAPRQSTEIEGQLNRRRLLRSLIAEHPGAPADDLVRILNERNIEVSSTLVMQELARGGGRP